jgi:hypothetical protein
MLIRGSPNHDAQVNKKKKTSPQLVISQINNKGMFSLEFSEPMNLEAFLKNTTARRLKAKSGGGSSTGGA